MLAGSPVSTLAEDLAEFAVGVDTDGIPVHVLANAKDRILDTVAVAVGAVERSEAGSAAHRYVLASGGHPEATLLPHGRRLPAASAALVNGTYAHSLDFDDSHLPSLLHPSAPMVPALLAQAEAVGATGRELLAALVVAYEINCRLGMAQFDPELRTSVMFERGQNATSIIGAVAAAAGCARLLRLDRLRATHSLATAAGMAAGLRESHRRGGSVKQLQCGWAAHSAVSAAALAAHGVTGPATVLEGSFGLFSAHCGDRWRPAEVSHALGQEWETPKIFFKPYPCNLFTQAIVDAALDMKHRGLRPRDVAHVVIGTAEPSWRTIGDPIERRRRPLTPYAALSSAPFVFATAMVGGGGLGVGLEDFSDEALADPARQSVAGVCDVVVDDMCTDIFPRQLAAVVTVTTVGGSRLESRVMQSRGGPGRPLSDEELERKVRMTAGRHAQSLQSAVAALDHSHGVDRVLGSVVTHRPHSDQGAQSGV